jgi:CubicO group peptidase (beta-lactamase class C family)
MSKEPAAPALLLEPTFDRTPQPFADGLPDPMICDASAHALRQRTVNFAAKRMTDMLYVSGLDRATAKRHFRWRPISAPGNLTSRPAEGDPAPLVKAYRAGNITIATDDAECRVTVRWNDPACGAPVVGAALARPGYGGILLGDIAAPRFEPRPIARRLSDAGNLIASGAGFATLRDYAKLGALYLQDGVWDGERLLPRGWADYALSPTHTGTSYAACFRANTDRLFPDLPLDTAWASGASDQRIFILRRHRMTVAVANETDHAMDLAALNRVIATAIATLI